MVRMIKRYGSRKLYDTDESRYVSLDEIAAWIRDGDEIRVLDNKSGEDVTAQTLSQIISEEGRRGTTRFPTELLHDLIRTGNQAITSTVGKVQDSVGKLVESSMDRLGPVRRMREETDVLRQRLEELEEALGKMEASNGSPDEEKSNGEPENLDMKASTRTSASGRVRTDHGDDQDQDDQEDRV